MNFKTDLHDFPVIRLAARLARLRWPILTTLAFLVLLAEPVLHLHLPVLAALAMLVVWGFLNGLVQWRIHDRGGDMSASEFLIHLVIDAFGLAALMFIAGGATNPLISLLLPLVVLAAVVLPQKMALGYGVFTVFLYVFLLAWSVPLNIDEPARAARMHLIGMGLVFVVSVAMLVTIIGRMMEEIRQRDAALATEREQALRHQQVVALGTQAAGAAHALGTPLATIAVIAGEMDCDPCFPSSLHPDLALVRQQIDACKRIITSLTERAGVARQEVLQICSAEEWVRLVVGQWSAQRHQARVRLTELGGVDAKIFAGETLAQALVNVLNNAADSVPSGVVTVSLSSLGDSICIDVRDQGPGFSMALLKWQASMPWSASDRGAGIGLFLARSAVEQAGGRFVMANDGYSALVRFIVPVVRGRS